MKGSKMKKVGKKDRCKERKNERREIRKRKERKGVGWGWGWGNKENNRKQNNPKTKIKHFYFIDDPRSMGKLFLVISRAKNKK